MPLLILDLEDTDLGDDTEKEVEGVAGGDVVLCKGCKDDCFTKLLEKDFGPVDRVQWCFHQLSALFKF